MLPKADLLDPAAVWGRGNNTIPLRTGPLFLFDLHFRVIRVVLLD